MEQSVTPGSVLTRTGATTEGPGSTGVELPGFTATLATEFILANFGGGVCKAKSGARTRGAPTKRPSASANEWGPSVSGGI